MIVSFSLILLAQLIGEVVARASAIPVPGPVIGMALMLGILVLRDRLGSRSAKLIPVALRDTTLENTSKGLLAHLSLMFVPAGVGIVGRLDVLAKHGSVLAIVVVVSVLATLTATVLTFGLMSRLVRPRSDVLTDGRDL